MKARQRESLFRSEAEKQAQIERYKQAESELATLEVTAQERLFSIRADRAELSRRIQELQNLELEL